MEQDRIMICGMFSPRIENSNHLKLKKGKKNKTNYSNYSKYICSINSPINLYSFPKNVSHNLFSPNFSKISTMLSPLQRILIT